MIQMLVSIVSSYSLVIAVCTALSGDVMLYSLRKHSIAPMGNTRKVYLSVVSNVKKVIRWW